MQPDLPGEISKIRTFAQSRAYPIIIPGLLFGILYPVLFLSVAMYHDQANQSGLSWGPLIVAIDLLLIAPALLGMTGAFSEKLRQQGSCSDRVLTGSYCAGFLGVFVACNLIMGVFSANQYVPYMEPGLMPRLAFVTGYAIFIFPVVMLVSAAFAGFSLAGGWLMHRRSGAAKTDSATKEQI